MILTTRAIVLKTINYSETSVIAKVFTEDLGLRSYMIKGVRTSKNKTKQNLLQPLSLIEMVVYETPKKDIQNIKEMKLCEALRTIPFDFTKMSVILFLNEILYKSLKETTQNKPLFDFIYKNILILDAYESCPACFHLDFMLKLSQYLGFEPLNNHSNRYSYFDLQEGCFLAEMKDPLTTLDAKISTLFAEILKGELLNELNRSERNYLQDILLKYYEIHLDGFGNVHSHQVLKDVLR